MGSVSTGAVVGAAAAVAVGRAGTWASGGADPPHALNPTRNIPIIPEKNSAGRINSHLENMLNQTIISSQAIVSVKQGSTSNSMAGARYKTKYPRFNGHELEIGQLKRCRDPKMNE